MCIACARLVAVMRLALWPTVLDSVRPIVGGLVDVVELNVREPVPGAQVEGVALAFKPFDLAHAIPAAHQDILVQLKDRVLHRWRENLTHAQSLSLAGACYSRDVPGIGFFFELELEALNLSLRFVTAQPRDVQLLCPQPKNIVQSCVIAFVV